MDENYHTSMPKAWLQWWNCLACKSQLFSTTRERNIQEANLFLVYEFERTILVWDIWGVKSLYQSFGEG